MQKHNPHWHADHTVTKVGRECRKGPGHKRARTLSIPRWYGNVKEGPGAKRKCRTHVKEGPGAKKESPNAEHTKVVWE